MISVHLLTLDTYQPGPANSWRLLHFRFPRNHSMTLAGPEATRSAAALTSACMHACKSLDSARKSEAACRQPPWLLEPDGTHSNDVMNILIS